MTYLGKGRGFAARALVLASVGVIGLLAACSSDPAPSESAFCNSSKQAVGACKELPECDGVVANGCNDLSKVLTASTVNSANNCIESGICGVSTCLARGQKSAGTTAAHKTLARSFCSRCATSVENCESQFYAPNSRLPGSIVLPYTEAVLTAVDTACTTQEDCQANFKKCAAGVVQSKVVELVGEGLGNCVAEAFRIEDSEGGPAGEGQVTTCTPTNCDGCCRDDKCEPGDTTEGCGVGAAACQICAGAQQCLAGACKEPCGPNNCAGCCDGDICKTGTEVGACGEGGAACDACTKSGASFVCSNRTCIDSSCTATCASGCCTTAGCQPGNTASACGTGGEACIDCGYGRGCTAAECTLDQNAPWDFYVSFATVPAAPKSGGSWDVLNGLGDPYLEAYSGTTAPNKHSGYTSTANDTSDPFWQERPLKGIKASELLTKLSIQIWDEDTDLDDFMGGCTIPLTAAMFDEALHDITCPATATEGPVKLYYRIYRPE